MWCHVYLLNEVNCWLEVETKVNELPVNAFTFVLFLFNDEHRVVEQLLKLLIRVVDAQLLERVHLNQHHSSTDTTINYVVEGSLVPFMHETGLEGHYIVNH